MGNPALNDIHCLAMSDMQPLVARYAKQVLHVAERSERQLR